MSDDPDHTRRWLVRASGAAILSNALTSGPSYSKDAGAPAAKAQDPDEPVADAPISPVTAALCDYVANTLDRNMPPEVVAKTKLHTRGAASSWTIGSCSRSISGVRRPFKRLSDQLSCRAFKIGIMDEERRTCAGLPPATSARQL